MHQSSFSELRPPSTGIDAEGALAWVLGVLYPTNLEKKTLIVAPTKFGAAPLFSNF